MEVRKILSVLLNSFNSAESILEVTFWNINFASYLTGRPGARDL